jgi:ubiquinone/menaquinone biosynthesis C-methylase UbiE
LKNNTKQWSVFFAMMNSMESFVNPQKILETITIRPGSFAVDIGSGTGAYTFGLARLVGENGTVFAVDIQKDKLDRLYKEANSLGFSNVHIMWGDAELPNGTKLAPSVADVIILANVLFMIDDRQGLIEEINRITKSKSTILVVDWVESFGGIGPHPSRVVSKDVARELFVRAGFLFVREIEAGSHHYGMIFNKS